MKKTAETIRKAKDKFAADLKELLEEFYNKTGIYITGINLIFHTTGDKVDKVVIEDIFLEEL